MFIKPANTVYVFALCGLKNVFAITKNAFAISVVVNAVGDENGFLDGEDEGELVLLTDVGGNVHFVFFAVGPAVTFTLSTRDVPVEARLTLRTRVVDLFQTVSDELLRATLPFVRVLHVPILTLYALVVFLILAILDFGNAEGVFVQSGQIGSVRTYLTVICPVLVLQTLRLVCEAH